jgi:hypothetical protein
LFFIILLLLLLFAIYIFTLSFLYLLIFLFPYFFLFIFSFLFVVLSSFFLVSSCLLLNFSLVLIFFLSKINFVFIILNFIIYGVSFFCCRYYGCFYLFLLSLFWGCYCYLFSSFFLVLNSYSIGNIQIQCKYHQNTSHGLHKTLTNS